MTSKETQGSKRITAKMENARKHKITYNLRKILVETSGQIQTDKVNHELNGLDSDPSQHKSLLRPGQAVFQLD